MSSNDTTPMPNVQASHICKSCDRPAGFRCSGCSAKDAWYCSKACQKEDWTFHIFYCKPKDKIDTAYFLARSAYIDRMPEHPQTRTDYGFDDVVAPEDASNLLGLYQGLFKALDVTPQDVRKWRRQGTLVEEIKAAYSRLPPDNQGAYYPWFLRNLWVLDKSLSPPAEPWKDFIEKGNRYCGIPLSLSQDERTSYVQGLPKLKQECASFCTTMLSSQHPGPEFSLWIKFGFCACPNSYLEMQLGNTYHALLQKCAFDEFYRAYETSALMALIRSKCSEEIQRNFGYLDSLNAGREPVFPQLEDVLSGSPTEWKTVWELKRFVMGDNEGAAPSIQCDYGFGNCSTEAECQELMAVYRKFFSHQLGDPLDLHKACLKGKIFKYLQGRDGMKLKKKFKSLMKNPYPLSDI
ncbi:hypothetical protein CERSUDRAFT_111190 [Gelatoporia subvermispora B]|uniref:MYND-type domain-containing protein n=1 Tax=Ceriporiopsis subvermispora (strain B) TaxID=914234 RepID=M2PV05_CERS8|nr:hypothetical protein CERSUDRAFT_111190 [Gelatoporia subvermispora B]